MTTANPTPIPALRLWPSAVKGIQGVVRGTTSPTTTIAATGTSATTASTTAPSPVGRTPMTLSAVSTTMKPSAINQRSSPPISPYQNPMYSTKSAGYTATSMKESIQDHQPT